MGEIRSLFSSVIHCNNLGGRERAVVDADVVDEARPVPPKVAISSAPISSGAVFTTLPVCVFGLLSFALSVNKLIVPPARLNATKCQLPSVMDLGPGIVPYPTESEI